MSWNLLVHCKVENDDEGWWILPRALTGITHSAVITEGDFFDFDGVRLTVDSITHKHVPPGSNRGPVSEATCVTLDNPISVDQMSTLINHGFKRVNYDSR